MLDFKQPVTFLFWTIGVAAVGFFARIGWELAGKLWGAW